MLCKFLLVFHCNYGRILYIGSQVERHGWKIAIFFIPLLYINPLQTNGYEHFSVVRRLWEAYAIEQKQS